MIRERRNRHDNCNFAQAASVCHQINVVKGSVNGGIKVH